MLQALLCCDSFTKTIIENKGLLGKNNLGKVLVEMLEAVPTARAAFPQRLLAEFQRMAKALGKTIDVYSQEGCQNGFTVFMELLNCAEINNLFINKSHYDIICQGCKYRASSESHEFSIQVTKDFINPLIKGGGRRTFNDWIKARVSIVDEWKCEKCKHKSTNMVRYETIATLSEVIMVFVIDMSRETYSDVMEFPAKDGCTLKYRMVAGIEHSGSLNPTTYYSSGHYKCHGIRDGKYYTFNDSSVSSASGIQSPFCHVIVYHRQ